MATEVGMDPTLKAKIDNMIANSNGRLYLESGYRDHALQAQLYAAAVQKYGAANAGMHVAPPGHSNHERGLAADIGGDMGYLASVLPQYGLETPMSWEPWHVEPVGLRQHPQTSPQAYPMSQPGTVNPTQDPTIDGRPGTIFATLSAALGGHTVYGQVDNTTNVADTITNPQVGGHSVRGGSGPTYAATQNGKGDMGSKFLAFVKQHESGGNYASPSGPGHWAGGAYQVMRDTWNHYGGYATADQAPPQVQDAFAQQHLQGIISATGSNDPGVWAAAWYLGTGGAMNWVKSGMDPNYAPPENNGFKVADYANQARQAVGTG